MRAPVPSVLWALAAAAIGAVILGEYELAGLRPILAGLLFGITVGEVIATLARPPREERYLLGSAALVTEAGLVWATWISTGHELGSAATTAWLGLAVGTVAAPLWLRSAGRRATRSPDGTAPEPVG